MSRKKTVGSVESTEDSTERRRTLFFLKKKQFKIMMGNQLDMISQ